MSTRKLSVVATALLSLVVCAPALALSHSHNAVTAPSTKTPGLRWKTDAPLREGMGRIRREVMALDHYEHGHIGARQAVALAGDIERDVGFVVSHCTLSPKADAALHPILAALMQGAQAIRNNPADLSAIPPMRLAVQRYPVLFDDADGQAAD